MCGIAAGILDLRQRATVPHETLRLMTDALSHRGLLEKRSGSPGIPCPSLPRASFQSLKEPCRA